jgi:hypothetical protein
MLLSSFFLLSRLLLFSVICPSNRGEKQIQVPAIGIGWMLAEQKGRVGEQSVQRRSHTARAAKKEF